MKKSLKLSLIAALALTVVACASTSTSLGTLRDTSVDAPDAAPADKVYAGKQPGKFALIERTFVGQPPLIPHTVENFDITPKENACLDCHIDSEFKGKKMPSLGKSHLVKGADANAAPQLNMLRWQCDSCHVPQVDAQPLVGNDFKTN
ncbi:MAG: hypothetical protein AUJ20_06215 [Comamonadaceae bacterium CG1_02_60_18]|nr:MAG: hypothetical protein AUJ20_06215 [Comamonadaceae bacterium CG1_02_60_18]PIQ50500.1 MAG: nitrate reductase [Comamonadaceae bacterium CG12_big_fil_rev_8_21_14_0_65_59_15]